MSKEKLQQILKDGKFIVHGIEYDLDVANTNNDPANDIAKGEYQRIHGVGPGRYIHAPLLNIQVVEPDPSEQQTPNEGNDLPGFGSDVVVVEPQTDDAPPPDEPQTPHEGGITEVEFEDTPTVPAEPEPSQQDGETVHFELSKNDMITDVPSEQTTRKRVKKQ